MTTTVSYKEKISFAKQKLESLKTQNRKNKKILSQIDNPTLFQENPYQRLTSTELSSILLFRGIILTHLESREILIDKLSEDDEGLLEKRFKGLKENVNVIQSALRGYQLRKDSAQHKESILQNMDAPSLIKRCLFLQSSELNLSEKSLSTLPKELMECKHLKTLILSKNIISEIPEWFSDVFSEHLVSLDLSQNCVTSLPDHIKSMKCLIDINVSFNQFESFPSVVTEMPLKKLEISSNLLTDIPEEITEMITLEYLDISNNLITQIPEGLTSMKKLTTAHIQGNRFDDLELAKKLSTKRRKRDGWQQANSRTSVSSNTSGSMSDLGTPTLTRSDSERENLRQTLSTSPSSNNMINNKKKFGFQIKGMSKNRESQVEFSSSVPNSTLVEIDTPEATPLVTDDERKEMNERSRLILEVVESERKYVGFLKALLEHYLIPLQTGSVIRKGKPILPSQQAMTLFPPDLSSLIHFNSALLKSLEESYIKSQGNAKSISETFIRMAPMFKLYVSYTSSYQKYVDEIRKLMTEKPEFSTWSKEVAKVAGDKLLSLLVMPIQRMV
jgi:Leucine-rich repeat (LRR) protein